MVHSSDRFLVNHLFLILKPVSHFVVDWNWIFDLYVVVLHSLSHVQLFATPWTAAYQASLSFTISQNLLELVSIESVMPSNYLILSCPLLLLPSIFLRIRIFSNELALCIRWPKYWRFSFSISYSNNIQGWFPLELTGLISLLSKSLLQQFKAQFKSINSSIFSLIYGANFTSILDYWKKQLWLYGPLLAKWCLCFLIHCLDLS